MELEMWETFVATCASIQTRFIFSFVSLSKVQTLSCWKSREEHKEEVLKQLFKNYLARIGCFALSHLHCMVIQSHQDFRRRKMHFCMKKRRWRKGKSSAALGRPGDNLSHSRCFPSGPFSALKMQMQLAKIHLRSKNLRYLCRTFCLIPFSAQISPDKKQPAESETFHEVFLASDDWQGQ